MSEGARASMGAILRLGRKDGANYVIPMDERCEPRLTDRFKKITVSVSPEADLFAIHEKKQNPRV